MRAHFFELLLPEEEQRVLALQDRQQHAEARAAGTSVYANDFCRSVTRVQRGTG